MSFNRDALLIARKFQAAEKKVAEERGEFVLFGIFEQEEMPGRWNLIASAAWLTNSLVGINELIDLLRKNMDTGDWKVISRIVPLDPSSEFVEWVTSHYTLNHQLEEVYSPGVAETGAGHAILITSNPNPSPASLTREPVAA